MDKKDYLDISNASDIKGKEGWLLYRLIEIMPGMISLGTLAGVLVFSWLIPSWVAIFIICFSFYYLFKVFYLSLHQIIGYLRVRKNMKTNWLKKLRSVKNWQKIYHVVILPHYKEDEKIIKDSLNAIKNARYPKEKIIIILSTEERAGEKHKNIAKEVASHYKKEFFEFLSVTHPDNIVGEIKGKGANVACAGNIAKDLINKLKISKENVLISVFDIDTNIYPDYFSCVTWNYLTQENPTKASYQPIPVYNNNIWQASFFARVVATSNTFWQMIQQERPEKLTTYSSHSMPSSVFFEVGYPSNVVADDSRIFWKSYFYYDGNYRVIPIYYLVSMDIVDSPNTFKTIINQYRQQKRWAWGCSDIPYIIFGFLNNKKISFREKFLQSLTTIDGYWSWATAALLLFLLGWLPIILGGQKFNFTILSFNLPILTSRIMTITLLGVLISAILSSLLLTQTSKATKKFKKISIFLQWIILPITLIIFGSLPALDAQIRLMFGKYMGFWVTEKIRK